ncbi:MAG: aminotransferase class III-fold pyridoxal phosphate-dependent enzyme [Actinobacteria bacterium]|nr:aminotransferase class III-fold pyridoxal phosphate-dependent enzyme [Actinomycetota bacterium]
MSDGARREELLARRRAALGPAYRHFYEDPVEVVRGEGTRLYDADGIEYLDAYNNVPCVGHSNPRVVAAIAEQAARLNTHTRYLAEPILAYSERLLASLGAPLGHVMFTCSGSEAVDVALRLARFETGRAGVVATANAYHGTTTASAEVSPSLGPAVAPGPTVRLIAAPSPEATDAEAEGRRMAAHLAAAVADLEAAGHGFAAFVCDSIFSSDGIRPGPVGLLRPLAEEVRRQGGLFVADEVQTGFARTGEEMWGFRRHGIEPDLVTLGKPMGNGMPIAATAARADLLDRFGRETRFFSTFGGNSVSIAAATAVLDEIEAQDLQQNALTVGTYLLAGLTALAHRSPHLANPRGAGLFLAVDIPDPDATGTPARLLEALRDRRVLAGLTGPAADTLKIRPPLVFSQTDADRLLAALDQALADLS